MLIESTLPFAKVKVWNISLVNDGNLSIFIQLLSLSHDSRLGKTSLSSIVGDYIPQYLGDVKNQDIYQHLWVPQNYQYLDPLNTTPKMEKYWAHGVKTEAAFWWCKMHFLWDADVSCV